MVGETRSAGRIPRPSSCTFQASSENKCRDRFCLDCFVSFLPDGSAIFSRQPVFSWTCPHRHAGMHAAELHLPNLIDPVGRLQGASGGVRESPERSKPSRTPRPLSMRPEQRGDGVT
jgi:hypothetical protein